MELCERMLDGDKLVVKQSVKSKFDPFVTVVRKIRRAALRVS